MPHTRMLQICILTQSRRMSEIESTTRFSFCLSSSDFSKLESEEGKEGGREGRGREEERERMERKGEGRKRGREGGREGE